MFEDERDAGLEASAPETYAKRSVTACALTNSLGWLRWFMTMVSGSMPKAW